MISGKYKFTFFITSIFYLLLIGSCKKSDKCEAGTGGNLSVRFEPQHHGQPIYSSANYRDTVYLKFNAVDFPGPNPSSYDLIVAGNADENYVNVSGLHCGQYFIMMTGFDTSAAWNTRVIGGIPYNFSESSGSQTLVIPVSE